MNIRGFTGMVDPSRFDVDWQHKNQQQTGIGPVHVPGFGMHHFWRPGMLTHQLEQLRQKDPEQFQRIVAQLADSLQQIADNSQTPEGLAAQLAQAFRQVANDGDVAALRQSLHHPRLHEQLQGVPDQQVPEVDANGTGTRTPSFGAVLWMVQGGGIARAIGTAMRQINEALYHSAATPSGGPSVSMSADHPSNLASPANSPGSSGVYSNLSATTDVSSDAVNASATPSLVSSETLNNSTTQGSIAAIQNAALLAIKTGV
jgi:hypothetical protein